MAVTWGSDPSNMTVEWVPLAHFVFSFPKEYTAVE